MNKRKYYLNLAFEFSLLIIYLLLPETILNILGVQGQLVNILALFIIFSLHFELENHRSKVVKDDEHFKNKRMILEIFRFILLLLAIFIFQVKLEQGI